MRSTIFLIGLLFPFLVYPQNTPGNSTAGQVIEGAKILVDVIKIFKKNERQAQPCQDDLNQYCIKNLTDQTIRFSIEPIPPTKGEAKSLIIADHQQECSYSLLPGIYSYTVSCGSLDSLIQKGEFKLEECDKRLRIIE